MARAGRWHPHRSAGAGRGLDEDTAQLLARLIAEDSRRACCGQLLWPVFRTLQVEVQAGGPGGRPRISSPGASSRRIGRVLAGDRVSGALDGEVAG